MQASQRERKCHVVQFQNEKAHKLSADNIVEHSRKLPVLDSCDVLVVGGGPSGLSAAIAASKICKNVILMEKYGCFGGTISHSPSPN